MVASEAWRLTEQTQSRINGVNARCVQRITGKSASEEASRHTRTYDLVMAVRQRRFKWLGHIFRMEGDSLVKLAVKVQYELGLPGNICMDAPHTDSFEDLVALANDRREWAALAPGTLIPVPTKIRHDHYSLYP